jgi:predicted enzyme related to lactoylglutathione lyase
MATATKRKAMKRAPKKAAKKAPSKKASSQAAAKTPPKATQPAGHPGGPGTFCWNELMTTDVAGARAFYGKLFGWQVEEMSMGPGQTYTLWKRGKDQAGGCMAMPPGLAQGGGKPMWTAYVQVPDVDATAKQAVALGGKVCHGPADIPGIGRFAVLTDPQGADICAFKPAQMS